MPEIRISITIANAMPTRRWSRRISGAIANAAAVLTILTFLGVGPIQLDTAGADRRCPLSPSAASQQASQPPRGTDWDRRAAARGRS